MQRKKGFIVLIVLLAIGIFTIIRLSSNHTILKWRITKNLEEYYGQPFECEALSVQGGGTFFVCYPLDDPSLLFDGMADSQTGGISYDHFVGAIFAKEDTRIMTASLSEKLGDVYVYGTPEHLGGSLAAKEIRKGDYTLDDLKTSIFSSDLFFYLFINTSGESYIDNPGYDYDVLSDSVNTIVEYYKKTYDVEICVNMYVYYVNDEEMKIANEFFKTHTEANLDLNKEIENFKIALQMGPEDNGHFSKTLRLTKEEYIEIRERMNHI